MVKTKTKILTPEDISRIDAEYRLLTDNLYRCDKPGDRELIDKAFRFANEAHRDMYRNSGEPYIIHPINVARIVNQEIGLGAKSMADDVGQHPLARHGGGGIGVIKVDACHPAQVAPRRQRFAHAMGGLNHAAVGGA